MKAACVLLCLATAASANILRHSPSDALDLQEWQHINQPQRQWNQEQHHQMHHSMKTHTKEALQNQEPLHHHSSEHQSPSKTSQEKDIYTQTMQETPHKHHHNHQHSSSSESASAERRNEQATYHTQDNKQALLKKHQMAPTRHTIMWRGFQMPVGSKSLVQNKEDIERVFGDAHKTMKHMTQEDKLKFNEAYERAQNRVNEDVEMNVTQLAQKYQYPVEEHTIKTDDGYILTVFRIPAKNQPDVQNNKVAFLMHDILGSADDWLLMGPGKSLAYLLSEEGYDVWLGNARGNKYSRRHVTKHPAVSDFWQFSIDEIALHDLPAMIDYVLKTTEQKKLHYVGQGQGTTAFFALTSTLPVYNDKVIMMYALAPMVYMSHVRSPLLRMVAPTTKYQRQLEEQIGNGAFTPNEELIQNVGGAILRNEIGNKKVSSNMNFVLSGINVDNIDADLVPVVIGHLPAGTSSKVIRHYGQIVASNQFRRYNYGPQINEKVYGQPEAPKYDMEKVIVPVAVFFSEEDWLAHPEDVARLQKELPNVKESYKLPEDDHFGHMDFQFSRKAHNVVYKQLIVSMNYQQYNYAYMQ